MSNLSPLTVCLTLGLVTGCHASPQKQREKIQQQQASWDATARLAHDLFARGALPAVYLRQVSEAVEQGREQVRQAEPRIPR